MSNPHVLAQLLQHPKWQQIMHNMNDNEKVVNTSFPCNKCSTITHDVDVFNDPTCSIKGLKAALIGQHIERCIHCALHYVITKYQHCKNNLQYYSKLSQKNIVLINPLLLKKAINKFEFFSIHFESTANLILNKYSEFAIGNLQELFMMLRSHNIQFVFKSEKNTNILSRLLHLYADNIDLTTNTGSKYAGFILMIYLVRSAIIKHKNSLDALLNKNMKSSHKRQCVDLIRGIKEQPFQLRVNLLICRSKLKKKFHVCCGNVHCTKGYLENKYGIKIAHWTENKTQQEQMIIFSKEMIAWHNREVINDWYICSGCKFVKYCSRRCQKISWSKQNHRYHCKIMQQTNILKAFCNPK
eukprot:229592_1